MLSVSVAENMGLGWKRVAATNRPEYFTVELIYSRKKFYSTSSGGQFVKVPSWSQSVTEFARGNAMNLVTLQVAPRSLVGLAPCLK
jgi:hypothetical protein